MGIIRAFSGAFAGTLGDQWKDIITVGPFDERTVVAPGILKTTNHGHSGNIHGSDGVITNGSKIFVPENTAAYIFSESGIEDVICEAGSYEYREGQESIFSGGGLRSIFRQTKDRIGYGGIPADEKRIAFVNLREIRGIKFGTRGPQIYNDLFYGTDLEITAHGTFTIQVSNPEVFVRRFLPANTRYYSFDDPNARDQVVSEFLQSFIVALNSLSGTYRVSQLAGHSKEICATIANDPHYSGTWPERFGFAMVSLAIENIEFTRDSRELIKKFSDNRMSVQAYDGVTQRASDIAAQQKMADGIEKHGFGNAAGMVLGVSMANGLGASQNETKESTLDERIETLRKLKGLVDEGILTQEEFDRKKKELMGL